LGAVFSDFSGLGATRLSGDLRNSLVFCFINFGVSEFGAFGGVKSGSVGDSGEFD